MNIQIGDRAVGDDHPPYVIAEIGSNHDGQLDIARELIEACAAAGADAVKFQRFTADTIVVDDRNAVDDHDDSLYRSFAENELPVSWLPELEQSADDAGVDFLVTPFSIECADDVAEYVPAIKLGSASLSHHKLLRHVAPYEKPVLLSTGMHDESEIRTAVDVLRSAGVTDLVLLHCVSAYPTDIEDANVRAVGTLRGEFDVLSGYSDHTLDPTIAPSAAVALGAAVIEKHVTLDRAREGPDHSFALEPGELDELVTVLDRTHRALGSGELRVKSGERAGRKRSKRMLYAAQSLKKGHTLSGDDVRALRPGNHGERGIEADEIDRIVGHSLSRDLPEGAPLREAALGD